MISLEMLAISPKLFSMRSIQNSMDAGNGRLKGACRHTLCIQLHMSHKYLPESRGWGIWCVTGVCCVHCIALNRNPALSGGGEWRNLLRCQFLNLLLCSWLSVLVPPFSALMFQPACPTGCGSSAFTGKASSETGNKQIKNWGWKMPVLFSVSGALKDLCSLWLGKGKEQALGIQRSSSCCWLLLNNRGKEQTNCFKIDEKCHLLSQPTGWQNSAWMQPLPHKQA